MTTQRLLQHAAYIVAAGLLLGACRQADLEDAPSPSNAPTHIQGELQPPYEHEFRFTLSGEAKVPEMGTIGGELKADYIMRERGGSYSNEYYPQLNFKIGSTEPVLLVFVREREQDSDPPIVFSYYAQMTVLDSKNVTDEQRAQGKGQSNRLELRTNIPLPQRYRNYSFAQDRASGTTKKWYVMGILGFTSSVRRNESFDATAYFGRNSDDDTSTGKLYNRGATGAQAVAGTEFSLASVPYISNWQPITINDNASGESLNLVFEPQGSLIQVDIAHNVFNTLEERRYGMISNVLDFSGSYDLSGAAIYQKFLGRDPNTGKGGLPDWVPDQPQMKDFVGYYINEGQSELSSGDTMFPWHLPAITDGWTPTWGADRYPGVHRMNLSDASLSEFSILPSYVNPESVTNPLGSYGVPHYWRFSQRSAGGRSIRIFWGMPRKAERIGSNPYTYIWTSAYSNASKEDWFYGYDFDPRQRIIDAGLEVFDFNVQLSEYDQLIKSSREANNAEAVAHYQGLKDEFIAKNDVNTKIASYERDKATYYGQLQPEAIKKRTQRTQPLMLLYQTKAQFRPGRISHIQTALTTDLMLTEVIHRREGGENYSLLEVYNPAVLPINLCDYAIARLIPSDDGSYLQYRRVDGSGTDRLSEAAILPLKSVIGGTESPFVNSPFSAWANQTVDTDYSGRYRTRTHESGTGLVNITAAGMSTGEQWIVDRPTPAYENGKIYLYQHQTVVIGASGYIHQPPRADNTMPWWDKLWNTKMYTNFMNDNQLYFYAYADGTKETTRYGEGTLDYRPGDAFVLLKSNGQGGWQIIDATGPIGQGSMGYFGTYAEHKAWLASLNVTQDTYFSLTRQPMINFPALPPYRTKKLSSDNQPDDWSLFTNEDQFSPGTRDTYNNQRWWGPRFWFTRTPLDPQWTKYRTNIPTKQ